MKITAAHFTGAGLVVSFAGGLSADCTTKVSLVKAGLARCEPLAGTWPSVPSATLPADPSDGRPEAETLTGFCDHPILRVLAWRWLLAVNSPTFEPGPVEVPTVTEAEEQIEAGLHLPF